AHADHPDRRARRGPAAVDGTLLRDVPVFGAGLATSAGVTSADRRTALACPYLPRPRGSGAVDRQYRGNPRRRVAELHGVRLRPRRRSRGDERLLRRTLAAGSRAD